MPPTDDQAPADTSIPPSDPPVDGPKDDTAAPPNNAGASDDVTPPNLAEKASDAAAADGAGDATGFTHPETAEAYTFVIPEDLGLKDEKGEPVAVGKDDPMLKELAASALKHKVPQEFLNDVARLYGQTIKETGEATRGAIQSRMDASIETELTKLETKDADGTNITGAERVGRLMTQLNTRLGDGASSKFAPGIISADIVTLLEKLLAENGEVAGAAPGAGKNTDGLRGSDLIAAALTQR